MFEVGKQYVCIALNATPVRCAFVGKDYTVLEPEKGVAFIVSGNKPITYVEYIPPPKMVKKSGWVNVKKCHSENYVGRISSYVYASKEAAIADRNRMIEYKSVIFVEWEEEEKC